MDAALRAFAWMLGGALACSASAQQVVNFTDITPWGSSLSLDGYATHVAVHPIDGGKVVAAINTSLRISHDGGAHWHAPAQPPLLGNPVERLYAHKGRPGVLFVQQTGIYNAMHGVRGSGRTYRSTDFGETWQLVSSYEAADDRVISPFASDPAAPEHLLATQRAISTCGIGCAFVGPAADEGIIESFDGGLTWTATHGGFPARSFSVRYLDGTTPAAPSRLFLTTNEGPYVSRDSGRTWARYATGLSARFYWVRQDPRNADVLYASAVLPDGSSHVLRSADDGASWQSIFSLEIVEPQFGVPFGMGQLAIDPIRPDRLWLSGIQKGVFLSEDGGQSWRPMGFAAEYFSEGVDHGTIPGTIMPSPGDSPQAYLIRNGRLYRAELAPRARIAVESQYGNRFWVTGDPGEALSQDYRANEAVRSGRGFGLWSRETRPADAAGLCRFQGNPAYGQHSRFITLQGPECEALRRQPGWVLEGEDETFAVPVSSPGTCPGGLLAVTRFFNGQPDVNHRYVADPQTAESMRHAGWIEEGVAFCARALAPGELE